MRNVIAIKKHLNRRENEKHINIISNILFMLAYICYLYN